MVDLQKVWKSVSVLKLRRPERLPAYAWSYYDHIAAVYVTLNAKNDHADQIIIKAKEHANDMNWGDIFLLESIVFSLQPPEIVQRNAWIVRERFREISCPTVYAKYAASNPPNESDSPDKLKADLTRLIDVLHWYYALIPDRERLRKSLTQNCIVMVLLYTLTLLAILIFCAWDGLVPAFSTTGPPYLIWIPGKTHATAALAACVVYWGIIGGFVSSQRRMQNIPSDGDPLISVLGLDDAGYYLWLSPLLGAVFAVVLAWMFMGGILTGAIFPNFMTSEAHGDHGYWFFDLFRQEHLKSAADYAKLFTWSFLAGFAERLVPDNLDRLASRLEIHAQTSAQNPGVGPTANTGPNQSQTIPDKTKVDEKPKPITPETVQNILDSGVVESEKKDD
jgi:hypothetical protein